MSEDSEQLQQKVDALECEVAALKYGSGRRGVRKRSRNYVWGLPLYDIAIGPDPDKSEVRGHARGVIALGDIATGIVAMGGVARGFIALGGVALGAITFGGCSIGILLGVGGLGIGLVALGGGAIGIVAVGGGAFGYYACGGGALGQYVISGMEQDPEAIRFFGHRLKCAPGRQGWPGATKSMKIPDRRLRLPQPRRANAPGVRGVRQRLGVLAGLV